MKCIRRLAKGLVALLMFGVFILESSIVHAGSLAPYIKGSGKYQCIAPRGFIECGPKPSNFAYAGRLTYNLLDQFTRRIHKKTTWEKAKLVLAPLFAQVPVTQALASASADNTKKELMESFLVAYIRSASHLPPIERQAREKAVLDILEAYRAGADTVGQYKNVYGSTTAAYDQSKKLYDAITDWNFSKLMKLDYEEMKKGWNTFNEYDDFKKKMKIFIEKSSKAKRAVLHATPRIDALNHFEQGRNLLSNCEFDAAEKELKQAKQLMMKYCQWAGYELRQMEKAKECYSTWYIDFMHGYHPQFPKNPQQEQYIRLHNDLVSLYNGLPRRLKLLFEIDRELILVDDVAARWNLANEAIKRHQPLFKRAIKKKDLKSACLAAREILGREKDLPEKCALKLNNISEKLITQLNAVGYAMEEEISNLMKQVKNLISDCRLKEAEQALQDAENMAKRLWEMDRFVCRQSKSFYLFAEDIGRLRDEVTMARGTDCRSKERPGGVGDLTGTWKWFNGDKVRITGGGAHSLTRGWVRGTIVPHPKTPNVFTFTWFEHGKQTWVDNLRLSDDKNRLSGANTMGGGVSATRMGAKAESPKPQQDRIGPTQTEKKRSCEECVRTYCPQCRSLLFCTSNDPVCADCITKNQVRIDRCQE